MCVWVDACARVCACACVRITCAWARAHKREGNKKQEKKAALRHRERTRPPAQR